MNIPLTEVYEFTMKQVEQNKLTEDIYLQGAWQVKDFAEDAMDSLREELTLKEENKSSAFYRMQTLIQESESVSIHVRQKIESEKPFHNPKHTYHKKLMLDYAYYLEAIEIIQKQINLPIRFFVFTDDIEWVKENFPTDGLDVFLVSEQQSLKDYEELILMSLCNHNIIANSTFSWWGAWLNSYHNKISISPSKKRWTLAHEVQIDPLFGKNWIRL